MACHNTGGLAKKPDIGRPGTGLLKTSCSVVVLFIPFLFHERVVDVERADKQLAVENRHLTGRNEVGITLLFCPSFSLPFKENSQNAIHEREGSKGQRRALGGLRCDEATVYRYSNKARVNLEQKASRRPLEKRWRNGLFWQPATPAWRPGAIFPEAPSPSALMPPALTQRIFV